MNQPILDKDAIWKKRYRASVVASTQVAAANPDRGLAVSNKSGIFQLYAWDTRSGDLRQVTSLDSHTNELA